MSLKNNLNNNAIYDDIYLVQKRISILFSIMGIFVVIMNIISIYLFERLSFTKILTHINVLLTFVLTVPFICFLFVRKACKFIQLFQIFIILFAGTVSVFSGFRNIAGPALWIISFTLLYKYNFFKKKAVLKISLLIVFCVCTIQLAVYKSNNEGIAGAMIISFLVFFILVLYIVFKAETDRILFSELKLKRNINKLYNEKDLLKEKIDSYSQALRKLESEIEEYEKKTKPVDLLGFKLTSSELEIVEILVSKKMKNKEIGDYLGINENTVKQHLHKIYQKIGVGNRVQLIDLFKYNYL